MGSCHEYFFIVSVSFFIFLSVALVDFPGGPGCRFKLITGQTSVSSGIVFLGLCSHPPPYPETISDSRELYSPGSWNSKLVVLLYSAVPEKSHVVPEDSNSHHSRCKECGARLLTTQR